MTLTLRPARQTDLAAIAQVHVASWQDAYRGILRADWLTDTVPGLLAARWQALPGAGWLVTLAAEPPALRGFIAVDLQRAGEHGAYVDNLHVDPSARGQGIGRRLMADAARRVLARDQRQLWLTVLVDNHPARAFYRALGGAEGPEGVETMHGETVHSLPIYWTDLPGLAALK